MDGGTGGERSSGELFRLSSQMKLLQFLDKFVVKSLDSELHPILSISRSDGEISIIGEMPVEAPKEVSIIYGVVGTIRLIIGTYILVITSRKQVGTYLGSDIYQVTSMKVLSCNQNIKLATHEEKKKEAYFTSLLKSVESTPGLFYSHDTDLTLNLQRKYKLLERGTTKPLWKQVDPRIVWNRNLLEDLIELKLDAFIVPIIQGSFRTQEFTSKGLCFKITIISRRCMRRQGTRMWRRGANLDGDTANFIETEQILEYDGFKSSYLQVRGSIPLLWEQIADLSYKPRIKIIDHADSSKIAERHFHDLEQRYGSVLAINLTDKHGEEGWLSEAYAAEMQKIPQVRYTHFDFHQNCRQGKFDKLQILYDEIYEDIDKLGFFCTYLDDITMEQRGVVRSNCIDCIDRTNVTQCFLAEKSLNIQLQKIGVLDPVDSIIDLGLHEKFKMLWVKQGDDVSLQYSGTHALKRDMVRYGRQTLTGLLEDGVSTLTRYYLNNFHDGIRQDAMDLISGHYMVSRSNSRSQSNALEPLPYLPMASALIVGGVTLTSLTLKQVGRTAHQFVSSVLWTGLTAAVMALVKANGRHFCSKPRLCGLL